MTKSYKEVKTHNKDHKGVVKKPSVKGATQTTTNKSVKPLTKAQRYSGST